MKRMFTTKCNLLMLVVLIFFFSCKKDIMKPAVLAENDKAKSVNAITGNPVPPLDWENISFMPGPPNSSPIPVPWQGGLGGAKIDDDIIFDYQKVNGWELVYNTFTTTARLDPLYFMLYNKYRGLLRVYFYIAPGGNYPSSNMAHFLNLRGANATASPILNFAAQDMIDISTHSQTVSQLQQYKVSTTGSWYAAEFELAYDPNSAQTPYDQLRLEWQINPNSITNIVLNGTQTGTIDGTISSTSGTSNFFSSTANSVLDAGLKIGADSLKTKNFLGFLPSAIKSAAVEAAKNGIAGLVKGFLSGILGGGSSTSTQKVSLKINTKINITGTATTESQLYDNVFSLPGTQNVTSTLPYYPNYGSPMGVFYISAKPVITRTVTSTVLEDGVHARSYLVDQRYSINDNSFQLIFNPAVTAVADIVNIRKQVIMLTFPSTQIHNVAGGPEKVGDKTLYNVFGFERIMPRPLPYDTGLAVRIIFDVVPKDGSPKCTIVKTFLASQIDG